MHRLVIGFWIVAALPAWLWSSRPMEAAAFCLALALGAWSLSFVQRLWGDHD
jgi:hypothetical protein